jgi:radical SAM protein with 4Fe4S-binding SPASM domain
MTAAPLSLILLPTLDCNAACDYCFEEKSPVALGAGDLPRLTTSILDDMEADGAERGEVYWQGGEALLLGPPWYAAAHDVMGAAAAARGRSFKHYLQTNLIGYGPHWNPVIRTMFDGSVGTSMDFPNDHRHLKGGSPQHYTDVWLRAVGQALDAGLDVGVIAVLHAGSLRVTPREFLAFFTERARITDLQVNLPFPGGPSRGGDTLEPAALSRFLLDLLDAWMDDGFDRGVRLGPFQALVDTYSGRYGRLPCIWQPNCANEFLTVDARGNVALCDCWVTSYPEHRFGNVFATPNLSEMLGASAARRAFLDRPTRLMDLEDCDTCPHLALCHGGCPVRTFAAKGTLLAKDPYCEVYKAVFEKCRALAGEAVRRRTPGLPAQRATPSSSSSPVAPST